MFFHFLFSVGFYAWGLLVGFMAIYEFFRAVAKGSVGVGTSTYVTMNLAFWIGGMMFFGIAALLTKKPSLGGETDRKA